MARFNPHHQTAGIYEAVAQWRDSCLIGDGSMLSSGEPLWTLEHLYELKRNFVDNPDLGGGTFYEKLSVQLEAGSAGSKQLMAEILWVILLFPSNVRASTKRADILTVWGWSGREYDGEAPALADSVLGGIGNAGQAYNTLRWREVGFLISVLIAFKQKDADSRAAIVSGPYDFCDWLDTQDGARQRQLRHVLPHLLFPDDFERMSSVNDKIRILTLFDNNTPSKLKTWPLTSIDREVAFFREAMEEEKGRAIDFYEPGIKERWKPAKAREEAAEALDGDDPDTDADDRDDVAEAAETVADYGVSDIVNDGCFMDPAEVHAIIDRVKSKKNIILQGPPGTGKTWLARRLGYALAGSRDNNRVRVVQFHPNLSYEDFVRGYRPTEAGLRLVDGIFMEMVAQALRDPRPHVIVIEEINRGNPAQILGEMLTLLEAGKRRPEEALALSYRRTPHETVHIPPNLHIIGTMNVADRSLAIMDLALRRRFAYIDLEPRIGNRWKGWLAQRRDVPIARLDEVERRMLRLNAQIASEIGKSFCIGHSFITPPDDEAVGDFAEWFQAVVATELKPLLEEYWFETPQTAANAVRELSADF